MGDVLTENDIYEGSDVLKENTPFDKIKFFVISVQQFQDISIITQMASLTIVQLRVCGFKSFPKEFFSLPNIESIDLSGNAISSFTGEEEWEKLNKLSTLNLSENSINNINEVFKINKIPNLRHLILNGNVCLSSNNSFNRIVEQFPQIHILDDSIITSQHRGFIILLAKEDHESLIPLSKIDDYIMRYVKFLKTNANNRIVHRLHAQFFCVNKILRRYSLALKIQCIYRGYAARLEWKRIKNAARFLQAFIRFWYQKRLMAARKIQCMCRRVLLKSTMLRNKSVKIIQSTWRKYKSRRKTIVSIFEVEPNIFKVYLTESSLENLYKLLEAHDFGKISDYPNYKELIKAENDDAFKIIHNGQITRRNLPASPMVYYNVEQNVLIKKNRIHNITGNSIWCGHNHAFLCAAQQVTYNGVNYISPCPFSQVKYIPYTRTIRTPKFANKTKYQLLKVLYFTDRKFFKKFIRTVTNLSKYFRNPDDPIAKLQQGITLFSLTSLTDASAQLTVHCAVRMFNERYKTFNKIKRYALNKRAAILIKSFIRTSRIKSHVSHISDLLQFSDSIPDSMSFFLTQSFIDNINKLPKKFKVNFGFSRDHLVCLPYDDVHPFLAKFIPTDVIVQKSDNLSDLIKERTMIRQALPSMFSIKTTRKTLIRGKIRRIIFSSPEEAFRRIFLFAYITNNFQSFMNDQQVIDYCAANLIQYQWRSHILRREYRHMGAQVGKTVNPALLLKYIVKESTRKKENIEPEQFRELVKPDLPTDEAIAQLRGDYRPWKRMKELLLSVHHKPRVFPSMNEKIDEDLKTESMRNVGLINDFDGSLVNESPFKTGNPQFPKRSYSKPKQTPKISIDPGFNIELESQNIFRTPFIKLRSVNPNLTLDSFAETPEAITPINGSPESFSNVKLSSYKNNMWKKDDIFGSPFSKHKKYQNYHNQQETSYLKSSNDKMNINSDSNQSESTEPAAEVSSLSSASANALLYKKTVPLHNTPATSNEESSNQTSNDEKHFYYEIGFNETDESESGGIQNEGEMGLLLEKQRSVSIIQEMANENIKSIAKSKLSAQPRPSTRAGGKAPKALINMTKKKSSKKEPSIRVPTPKLQTVRFQPSQIQNSEFSDLLIPENASELSSSNVTAPPTRPTTSPSIMRSHLSSLSSDSKDSKIYNSKSDFSEIELSSGSTSNLSLAHVSYSDEITMSDQKFEHPSTMMRISSPQWADNSFRDAVRRAFTKLARLHQIGVQIQQAMVVDNEIAEKQNKSFVARNTIIQSRQDRILQKQSDLQDLIERNKIEKLEREEKVKQVRAKTALTRNRNANKIRTIHKETVSKYKKERNFALHFVSVSRQVAQVIEKRHLQEDKRKQLENAANSASKLRQEALKTKEKYKQKIKEIENDKRRVAAREKEIVEEKRLVQAAAHEQRIALLAEIKENANLMKEALKEYRTQKKYIPSNMPPPLETDEVEGAAMIIREYIYGNLGEVESHLICDIISEIVS